MGEASGLSVLPLGPPAVAPSPVYQEAPLSRNTGTRWCGAHMLSVEGVSWGAVLQSGFAFSYF